MDAIGSTAQSHQRSFVVEVMGRHCGYLALMSAIAGNAAYVLIPEWPPDPGWERELCEIISSGREAGRRHSVVVVAEGACDSANQPITSEHVRQLLEERAGRGHPGDDPRARATRRRAQRLRPVDELHPRPRRRRGGAGGHATERPAADRAAGPPGGQGAADGVRRQDPRAGRPDRGQGLRHRAGDARRPLHRDGPHLPLHLPCPPQHDQDQGPPQPDRPAQRRRAGPGHERRRRGRGAARAGPWAHDARRPRQLPRPDRLRRAGAPVGRRRGLVQPRRRRAGDQPAGADGQRPVRHQPRPGRAARRRAADHRRLGRVRGGLHDAARAGPVSGLPGPDDLPAGHDRQQHPHLGGVGGRRQRPRPDRRLDRPRAAGWHRHPPLLRGRDDGRSMRVPGPAGRAVRRRGPRLPARGGHHAPGAGRRRRSGWSRASGSGSGSSSP